MGFEDRYLEIKTDNIGEDSRHCLIIELSNWYNVKVANKSWRDWITTSSGWAQRANELNIHQANFWSIFFIIPRNGRRRLIFTVFVKQFTASCVSTGKTEQTSVLGSECHECLWMSCLQCSWKQRKVLAYRISLNVLPSRVI